MYDPRLSQIISQALLRLQFDLARAAPVMAGQVAGWMEQLAGAGRPEGYFQHPLAFPALLLPWWLEESFRPEIDLPFQADLVYSTINGYYYVRLIDNLMDGEASVELGLLPALGFFHTQFQGAYQAYFSGGHPFWQVFRAAWFFAAEAVVKDAGLADIDLDRFWETAAQKVSAVRIPLAAVCYRYHRPDLIDPWSELATTLGGWHQFLNDMLDWQSDLARGGRTYFLSEAARRGRQSPGAVTAWVIEEGFEWGVETLLAWLANLQGRADRLNSPPLLAYLHQRGEMLRQQQQEAAAGRQHLARLLALAGEKFDDA